jgi:hypothetical protein
MESNSARPDPEEIDTTFRSRGTTWKTERTGGPVTTWYAVESPEYGSPSVREQVAEVQDRVMCDRVVVFDPPLLTRVVRVST